MLFDGTKAYFEGNRLPNNALWFAQNSRFPGGRWASRQGYSAFGDAQTGGTNVKGLIEYKRFPSGVAMPYLTAYYNSSFYRYDVSSAVDVSIPATGWTAGDVAVEGVSYNSKLYVGNGVDLIGKIDDTTFSTIASSPRARLLETCFEKMWCVDNTAPATVQYTLTATASVPSNIETWTGAGTGGELIGKGGRVEALKTLDKQMYVFKKDIIDVFTGMDLSGTYPVPTREPISKNTGAVNNRAVTIVENDIWFLTPNMEIRSLGQEANYFQETRTKDMSEVINRYKRNLDPDQSGAVAWYVNRVFKLALKENGSSQNNIIFTYDWDTGGWGFDYMSSPQVACTIDGSAYFGVGGTSGIIYKDETGYSDNGSPMGWGGKTGLTDDGRPDMYKYARYLYVRGARSEDVVIKAYLLGEDFRRLETVTIEEPTAAQIAEGSVDVEDAWGQVGDIVGGTGYSGGEAGAPAVYRFNKMFSVSSTDRLFGIEFESTINGQRIFIDEAKLKYIPRPERYTPIDA